MNHKNTKLLFLALSIAALSGCSTAYKMGQTPDDVYYSPAKVRAQAQASNDDNYLPANGQPQRYSGAQSQGYASNGAYDSYEDFDAYRNDRFLRLSIGNSMYMGAFNDYYMYDGYSNWKYPNYAYNINSPWNSYYYWNNYFNPYNTFNYYNPYYGGGYYGGGFGGGGIIIDKNGGSTSPISRPRAFNPGNYSNNSYSNSNLYLYRDNQATTTRPGTINTGGRYNNTNTGNNTMRRLPATGNTYYNTNSNNTRSMNNSSNNNTYTPQRNTYEAPTRSYTPSPSPSSSGSSSGGSSGGGGGVSRPSRGN